MQLPPKAQWAELVEIIEARLTGNEFLFEPAPELTATAELDFVHYAGKQSAYSNRMNRRI